MDDGDDDDEDDFEEDLTDGPGLLVLLNDSCIHPLPGNTYEQQEEDDDEDEEHEGLEVGAVGGLSNIDSG